MTVEYVRYKVADAARGEELQLAYRHAARQLDSAPECLAYELAQCEEDATSWILRIEWRSTADHLKGFRTGRTFPLFLNRFADSWERLWRCGTIE